MPIADKDLGNGPSTAACNHFLAEFCIIIDVDLMKGDTFSCQQAAGALAVRAPAGHVHGDLRLRRVRRFGHFPFALAVETVFVNGRLSLIQAFKPPSKLNTLVNPSLVSVRAALAPPMPLSS